MTHKTSLNIWATQILIVIFAISSLTACERLSDESTQSDGMKTKTFYNKPRSSRNGLWERLRKNFNIIPRQWNQRKHAEEQKRIQHFVNQYHGNENQMNKISRASPYLYYIVEELEKRNMPGELALLPMIESAFEPQATSNKGAAGLWQFMGRTGKEYGLKQDKWYDGRRDITASTKAALEYLKFLHDEFNGNWMLALAAYNAGPGTVNKAIKRNIKKGLPTNFWDLKLPKQTLDYVPKFLALAEVIKNPDKHDFSLPNIENKPYFVPVDANKHLSFSKVAKLSDMNVKELKKLNPGYRKQATHPTGPKQLLMPSENAKKLKANLIMDNTKDEGLLELLDKPKSKGGKAAASVANKTKKIVKDKIIAKNKGGVAKKGAAPKKGAGPKGKKSSKGSKKVTSKITYRQSKKGTKLT